MVKIGLVCWRQGGGTNDYVKPAKQPWLKDVKIVQKGQYKGLIPFEKALQAALLYKYDDVEVNFINKFDEKLLEKNDVNFLVSLNLLAAWEKSDAEYKRVEKLMQKPSLNFYPNLKEQFFLFDKGDYLEYYQKKGIPIAPTFVVRGDRNPKKILDRVKKEGWKSFVLKPHRAYANIGIGKFDKKQVATNSVQSQVSTSMLRSTVSNPNAEKEVSKFLTKNKKFPAFVCQEVMNGFAKFWEIKSFWINGEFKYYVAMKAADKVFSESKIYGSNPAEFGKVSPKVLKDIKQMGKKIVDMFPKMNPHSQPPLYLRIDFGCCRDNTMDGESYFLNEVEYAGCAIFTMEGVGKNIFDTWVKAYYGKAKEFVKGDKPKVSKKTKRLKRVKRAKTSRQHRYKTRSYRGGAGSEGTTKTPDEVIEEAIKKFTALITKYRQDIPNHENSAREYLRKKNKPMAIEQLKMKKQKVNFIQQMEGHLEDLRSMPSVAKPPSPTVAGDNQNMKQPDISKVLVEMKARLDQFNKAGKTDLAEKLKLQIQAVESRQALNSMGPSLIDMMKKRPKGATGGSKKRKRTKKKKTRK